MRKFRCWAVMLLFIFLCAACAPAAAIPPTPSPTALPPTSTPLPAATPTAVPSLTPTPGCTETRGRYEQQELPTGLAAPKTLPFRVYLPPCYGFNADARYPLLVMLHGQTFTDDQWDRLGMDETADRLIASGEIRPLLIAMPLEERYLDNPDVSGFDSVLLKTVLPWIDSQYAVCAGRGCHAVGGLSRGGAWALRLGFEGWQLFGQVGAHSVPPFTGDIFRVPNWTRSIPAGQVPRFYMDIGENDPYRKLATDFEGVLTRYKVPHEWHLNKGTHNEAYWQAHVEEYLRWYSAGWQ